MMKLLVSGDVKGNFKTLFTRVQNVVKKTGSYDMLFCVGSFFDDTENCREEWKAIKDGTLPVPLPVYILGPQTADCGKFFSDINDENGDLVDNITCLGQRGVYTTSGGLKVAYLSGGYDGEQYKKTRPQTDTLCPSFNHEDIASLLSQTNVEGYKGIDILLTSAWPQGVANFTTTPPTTGGDGGSLSVSKLAVDLLPRYHFVGSLNCHYERLPYRNHEVLGGEQKHVTRFIALATVGNPDKKNKYLYAFKITPMSLMDSKDLHTQPHPLTDCPYKDIVKKSSSQDDPTTVPPQNFFFDPKVIAAGQKRQQDNQRGPPTTKRPQSGPPKPQGPCWFCLGSPDVEKHLVVSIGNQSYLAFGKGGLVDDHVMILPIGHYPATVDTPQEVADEMNQFKMALRQYFVSRNKSCIMFERNFRSQHLQIQVVPVTSTEPRALRQAFIDHGKQHKLQFAELEKGTDLATVVGSGSPYFFAEFDDGISLLAKIRGFFPLQFGREVLASPLILNVPNRVHWKACALDKDGETALVQSFRTKFQPFDFTLEDDDD